MKIPTKIQRLVSLGWLRPEEQSKTERWTSSNALQRRKRPTQDHFADAVVDADDGQGAESNARVAEGKWDQDVAGNHAVHFVTNVLGHR